MISRTCILTLIGLSSLTLALTNQAEAANCQHHHFDVVQHLNVVPVARGFYPRRILICETRHPSDNPYFYYYLEGPHRTEPRPYPDLASAVQFISYLRRSMVDTWSLQNSVPKDRTAAIHEQHYEKPKDDRPLIPRISQGDSGLKIELLSPSLIDLSLLTIGLTPYGRIAKGLGSALKISSQTRNAAAYLGQHYVENAIGTGHDGRHFSPAR